MSRSCDANVIVVGAGPVGLTLALGLAHAGVDVLVLEAEPELADEARASTWHASTLDRLHAWGAAEPLVARGVKVDRLQFWERSTRRCVAELPYALLAGDTRFPFRLQCPQREATPILRDLAVAHGARFAFGHRVVAVHPGRTAVTIDVEVGGERRSMRARYLAAADGARSVVRTELGLGFAGKTYEDRFLLCAIDGAVPQLADAFPGLGPVAYVFDPDEWVIVMRQRSVVRIVFRLDGTEDASRALEPAALSHRLEGLVGCVAPPVVASSYYAVHQRVASRFRDGRVVLLGDAAHVNNPTGGLGMNSGIHDAHALVAPLVGAARGELGARDALERWARERRDVAVRGVQRDSEANYLALTARDEPARAQRDRELAAFAADPERARRYLLRASLFGDHVEGTGAMA